ncbi:hypothetical protein Tco_0020790 [Tanacetum coccineum]
MAKNRKLYDASSLHDSKMHVNVCDTNIIIEDADKSRLKMKEKLNDLIATEKKRKLVADNTALDDKDYSYPEKEAFQNFVISMESELSETLKQNELLNDRLLEATLTHDIVKCVLIHPESRNDTLSVEIEKIQYESKEIQENLLN